jgi:dinuclear metal center YbgI/SA1388 family protein
MTTLAALAGAIDDRISFADAADWDRVGIQFGDLYAQTGLVGVCHEVNEAVMKAVLQDGVRTLVTYHPLLFEPATALIAGSSAHGRTYRLIRDGVALISVHTAFDAAEGGTSDALANAVGIETAKPFAVEIDGTMIGRVGPVRPRPLNRFADHVQSVLASPGVRVAGAPEAMVHRVAVLPGSGGRAVTAALEAGADALVTGDISHHVAAAAVAAGLAIIDAGHMPTERPGMVRLVRLVSDVVPSAIDFTGVTTDPWEG